ncbi:cassette chromosome ssDNA-binding protein [Staphylococcus equorum]|uniref:cassette chromosome ssDNA-binding protein n=1 Tax=Staphylococcus equorum TaxID=246432 RepID=UPI0021C13186|nr:single-stranded DNA-binding protein [Staphylococcus equorum]
MKYKGEDFNEFKRRILGAAFSLSEDITFKFSDLNLKSGFTCSTEVQQEVGRWFSYFVKHTPNVPFVIIGKNSNGNLVYRKTGPNPMRHKRNWKGGNN